MIEAVVSPARHATRSDPLLEKGVRHEQWGKHFAAKPLKNETKCVFRHLLVKLSSTNDLELVAHAWAWVFLSQTICQSWVWIDSLQNQKCVSVKVMAPNVKLGYWSIRGVSTLSTTSFFGTYVMFICLMETGSTGSRFVCCWLTPASSTKTGATMIRQRRLCGCRRNPISAWISPM